MLLGTFLREVEFGNDGDYSEERFINIVNAHLANTIGISTQNTFVSATYTHSDLCALKLLMSFGFCFN